MRPKRRSFDAPGDSGRGTRAIERISSYLKIIVLARTAGDGLRTTRRHLPPWKVFITPRAPPRSRTSPFAECTELGPRRARTTERRLVHRRPRVESPRAPPFFTPPRPARCSSRASPRRSCSTVATFAATSPSPADAGAATCARISVRPPPSTPAYAPPPAPVPLPSARKKRRSSPPHALVARPGPDADPPSPLSSRPQTCARAATERPCRCASAGSRTPARTPPTTP